LFVLVDYELDGHRSYIGGVVIESGWTVVVGVVEVFRIIMQFVLDFGGIRVNVCFNFEIVS
jgi:hypothetical protein